MVDSGSSDERRQHSRVTFSTEIQIRLEAEGKNLTVEGSSKDLSLRGIFVNTGEVFPMDANCLITIYLTGGVESIILIINGRVVRTSAKGMGIAFDSMDVDSYSHLKNIVLYNSADTE